MTNNKHTPASSPVDSLSSSVSPSKKLLNSYLKSTLQPTTTTTTTNATKQSTPNKNYRAVRQLDDLDTLLAHSPQPAKPASDIKQLGSIQSVLQGSTSAKHHFDDQPVSVSPYQKHHFFAKKSPLLQTDSNDSNSTPAAFATKENIGNSLFHNFRFLAFATFAIGACIFGINQLIKNANLNFAAQNQDNQDSSVAITPPRILTFQGRLSNYAQESITQPKTMRFTLYNTSGGNAPPPVGGQVLWDSNLCQVIPNRSGIFTVNLGAGSGEGADDYNCGASLDNIFAQNSNIWLQITVDDEVLFPRQLIKSVPYALNSETLQGFPASQSATANTVPVVDNNGNLQFNTPDTSIINTGNLNLVSQTGNIQLLPAGGTVNIGNQDQTTNLFVTGDATLSGQLNLTAGTDSTILYHDDGLFFKSAAGQNAWQTQMTLTNQGKLGLGTTTPSQQLTLSGGSLAFDFISGPNITGLQLSEDITDPQALRRIDAPATTLHFQARSEGNSSLQAGHYRYAYTFVTSDGTETALSPLADYQLEENNQSVLITNLATSSHPSIVARNIYRTHKDGDEFYLLKTISDNISTSAYDNLGDSQLHQLAHNLSSTGNYRYRVTFVTEQGESQPSSASNIIHITGDGRRVKIDNLPLSSPTQPVLARKVYRTLADSQEYYLVATLNDNTTTTIYDSLSDQALLGQPALQTGGGIYANNKLALQFNTDGSLVTNTTLVANGRVEATHNDNQGLKLPTSIGKPFVKVGQQVGDIVYDSVGQTLYIYNGLDFVATGLHHNQANSLSHASNCSGNLCRLVLDPEYAGAVITGDGSDNQGIFSSGQETVGTNYNFNYYQWQSANNSLNDFDTTVNLALPNNFISWQDNALTLDFLTQSTDYQDNSIDLEVSRGGTSISISRLHQAGTAANQWMSRVTGNQPLIITGEELTSLGFQPGDTLTLKIKTASKNNNLVKIGQINLNYNTDSGIINTGTQSLWKQVAGAIFPTTNSDIILGGDSTASASIGFFNLAGTGTPTLYVRGNLFLNNASQHNYLDLAEQSSFNIRTMNADQTSTTHFTILPNGNIGIGTTTPTEKLEVEGNVKVNGTLQLSPQSSSEAGDCNAESEGKIYYDINQATFFACQAQNSTRTVFAWIPLN